MNASVSPVYVTALLRKSTAMDFLQKIRETRSSECFPGGCSTEISEAGELIEADVGYVSSLSIVLYFTFDANTGFSIDNMYLKIYFTDVSQELQMCIDVFNRQNG